MEAKPARPSAADAHVDAHADTHSSGAPPGVAHPNGAAIARYVAGAPARPLPPEVREAARLCLVDWVAVCTGAQAEGAAAIVRSVAQALHTRGRSTLLLGGEAAAAAAALANGTLAHCLDFDDTYVSANTHTSAPVWAATLALGEEIGASEEDMLAAFVAGFETSARVGHGLGEAVTQRGFHATGVFGRQGAAAASCALLGLEAGAVGHALGLAATQAGGLVGSFGTMAKPFHAGKAAMDGVLSAQLAAAGFAAATGLLETGGALERALIQDGAHHVAAADFGRWAILDNSIKLYAACHLTHPAVDAARALAPAPGRLAAIRSVRARVGALARQVTGGKSGAPDSGLQAKFDLKYCVALALHGRALSAADFAEPLPRDEAVLATAAKVQVEADARFGFASGEVELAFADGQTLSLQADPARGHPGNPVRWQDMREKFEALVEPAAGSLTGEIFDCLRSFGDGRGKGLATIRRLSSALQA